MVDHRLLCDDGCLELRGGGGGGGRHFAALAHSRRFALRTRCISSHIRARAFLLVFGCLFVCLCMSRLEGLDDEAEDLGLGDSPREVRHSGPARKGFMEGRGANVKAVIAVTEYLGISLFENGIFNVQRIADSRQSRGKKASNAQKTQKTEVHSMSNEPAMLFLLHCGLGILQRR